ncbi:MAG: enoyl-CoA hydratase/isomerase family protein [Planctomycetota bacterium]|nr:MAG: enoyl-CoA hydratase/isomerase family protein [Planctomycetota bacterium]
MTTIEVKRDGDVCQVCFQSEKGINVFSSRVIQSLGEQVSSIAESPELRYVVFGGCRTFVAGADIKEMSAFGPQEAREFARLGHSVFDAIERLPQVTFAAITGHALGGGCELALACDFRIATKNAKLGQPESRLGLIPGWGGTRRLVRLVGRSQALKLMLSGEHVDADEAARIGLIDEVVSDREELESILPRWYALMRQGSPKAIARIKRALLGADEIDEFAACFECEDGKEGMQAFLEKRPAGWMQA